MTSLLPCPCCGQAAELVSGAEHYIICTYCGLSTMGLISSQAVVERWNRRDGEKDALGIEKEPSK